MKILQQLSDILLSCSSIVTVATRLVLKAFLRAGSWLSLGIAALAFWVGGRAISEFAKVDRILAEFLGLLIAVVTGIVGYALKTRADDLDGAEGPGSQ